MFFKQTRYNHGNVVCKMHTPKSVWIVTDKYTMKTFKRKVSERIFDLVNCN